MLDAKVPRGHETILLTEDYEDVRKVTARMLRLFGYHVLETRSGQDTLFLLEKHPDRVHLFLTDLELPSMSGFELSRRVRSKRPEIKVLYMSGYTCDQNELSRILANESNYIQKPFTIEELAVKVREVLNGSQSQ